MAEMDQKTADLLAGAVKDFESKSTPGGDGCVRHRESNRALSSSSSSSSSSILARRARRRAATDDRQSVRPSVRRSLRRSL